MGLTFKTKKCLDRWYPLRPIPIQLRLIRDTARFKIVPAGRRSGKTERAKRYMIRQCLVNPNGLYAICAPTYNQVKKIYWKDLKIMSSAYQLKAPSESELIITFRNGTELHLIGLDKPDRMEGPEWDGIIVDEAATVKESSWLSTIYPALQTYNPTKTTKAWCWIIGRPKGRNWFYRLFKYASSGADPDFKAYTWFSSEVLPAEEITKAKARLPVKLFKQEFEASFETTEGLLYEDYGPDNLTTETIQPHEQILYFCDFNYTPMSHGLGVLRDHYCDIKDKKVYQAIYFLDEVVLKSATVEYNAMEFCERYKNHQNKNLVVYGDRSGRNGEKHAIQSYYDLLIQTFERHGWVVEKKVKAANPSIVDRQNSVRVMIRSGTGVIRLFVNAKYAVYGNEGLSTVCTKPGSSYLEDDSNEYQHITTALGYFCDYEFPISGVLTDIDQYLKRDYYEVEETEDYFYANI